MDPLTISALAVGYWLTRGEPVPWGERAPGEQTSLLGHEVNAPSQRGRVLPLTLAQRVNRALYLAGELPIEALDPFVVRGMAPSSCPEIYYRLKDFNGGKDPTAPDPATRWTVPNGQIINRTSDCIGGAAWCGGFDRFQPARFGHIYGGWINTDSMLADAMGPQKCFATLERPQVGCFVVAGSGSGGRAESIGHIGTVVNVPVGIPHDTATWWRSLGVVDIAARDGRANRRTTGAGWAPRDSRFVIPIMKG
jgi:hypothetical protein